MATTIPVIYLGDPDEPDNTPPTVLECTEGSAIIEQLQAAILAARPAPSAHDLAEAAKKNEVTFQAVIETPSVYLNWLPEQWRKSLRDTDVQSMGNRIALLLDDETIPIDSRNLFARILSKLNDRRGFDWNLNRFKNADPTDFSGASGDLWHLYLAGIQNREWLAGLELWPLIEPRLSSDQNNENIGKDLCPGKMQQWYIKQMQRDDLPGNKRVAYLNELSWYAPSVEALEACSHLFDKPGPDYEWSHTRRYAETLTRFGQGGNMDGCSHPDTLLRDWIAANSPTPEELTQIRARVCEYAANLFGHDHWVSREYHNVICEFGGEEWRDYFEQGLNVSQTQYHAFAALVRLAGDERDRFLRKHAAGFEGQQPYLQSQALNMLSAELVGTKDPELTRILTTRFRESSKKSDVPIRRLFLIGSTEIALDLLAELRASDPQPAQPDLTQLLAVLSSFGIVTPFSVDEINQRIMPQMPSEHLPHKALIDPKEQVRQALRFSGLRTDVDMVIDFSEQLAVFSTMARGEFDADLVHVNDQTKTTFFRYQDFVFHYAVPYPEEYQYPLTGSAVANAALRQVGNPNRFVPYGNFEGMSDIAFYFGSHKLAKTLQDQYGVEFIPGWEKSFDSP